MQSTEETQLKDLLTISEAIEYCNERIHDPRRKIAKQTIHGNLKQKKKTARDYAPSLIAEKKGAGPHGIWLITRESLDLFVAWKNTAR